MESGTTNTLANMLTTITTVFTAALGWVQSVATTISDTPLLLVGCVICLIGVGVTMFKRMFHI
ncbi:MAG: hypothetical protein NC489_32215 [Ruminococcus flavefaciens]|nr:hypothetical protein [Ruminococcus flavefaciens]